MKAHLENFFKLIFKIFSFLAFILLLIFLVWGLKTKLSVGDEVIAGISGALITLLGVYLTNLNSQKALDKQLEQQRETFNTQLKEQSNLFVNQISHQTELLTTQLEHQTAENLKNRIYSKKESAFFDLIQLANKFDDYMKREALDDNKDDSGAENLYRELKYKIVACQFISDGLLMGLLQDLQECCSDTYFHILRARSSLYQFYNKLDNLQEMNRIFKEKLNSYNEMYKSGDLVKEEYDKLSDMILLKRKTNGENMVEIVKECNEEKLRIIRENNENYKKFIISTDLIMSEIKSDLGFVKE